MADHLYRRSPLHGAIDDALAAADEAPARVRLTEVPFLTQLTLRVAPGTAAATAAGRALGAPLPTVPNTTSAAGEVQVLWMGPDEWLVVGPTEVRTSLRDRLEAALAGEHATVVDVSAHRTVIEVAGSDARLLLTKGCSVDLHPRTFEPGRCAQTILARAQVVLLARTPEPAYWVFARASFAEYVAEWLLDASGEYRGAPPADLSLEHTMQMAEVQA
jgi:sarcosine oxidase, subunit gamma